MYNNMVSLEVMIMNHDYIDIKGARENNLKNIDIRIPRVQVCHHRPVYPVPVKALL